MEKEELKDTIPHDRAKDYLIVLLEAQKVITQFANGYKAADVKFDSGEAIVLLDGLNDIRAFIEEVTKTSEIELLYS
ncbi:MAG: hypothetical protein KBS73_07610 [Bacteroidales bacterium]|nr:hypothetical protein [Candidatus Cacconaster equifaecalis]